MRRWFHVLWISAATLVPAFTADLPIQEITDALARMERQRAEDLQDYSVTRKYELRTGNSGHDAEMLVRVNYCLHRKKSYLVLSQRGAGTIQSRVFRRLLDAEIEADERRDETRFTPENYEFRLAGTDVHNSRACYLLDLIPKRDDKFLVRGRIWVDKNDFAVIRLEGSPARNCSFWTKDVRITREYRKIGPFWLCSSHDSQVQARIIGPTRLLIKYYNYEINRESAQNRFPPRWRNTP